MTTNTLFSLPLALKTFINPQQLQMLKELVNDEAGEEFEHFNSIAADITKTVNTMPKTYDTEDVTDPKAYLHYFMGGWDWYIIERDMYAEQNQAFGLVKSPYTPSGELGYISIPEILGVNAELDYYYTPQTLSQLKGANDNE